MNKNNLKLLVPFRKKNIGTLIEFNLSTKEVKNVSIALNDIFSKTILDNILASGVIEDGRIIGKDLFASMEAVKQNIFEDPLFNVGLTDDQKRNGSRMIDILNERAIEKANVELSMKSKGIEPVINDDLTVSWDNLCKTLGHQPASLYGSILKVKKRIGTNIFKSNFIKTGFSTDKNGCGYSEYKITQYGLNLIGANFRFLNSQEKLQEYNKAFTEKQQALLAENSKLKSMQENSRVGFAEKITKLSEMSGKKIIEVIKELEKETGVKIHKIDNLPQEIFNSVNKIVDKKLNNLEFWESVKPV